MKEIIVTLLFWGILLLIPAELSNVVNKFKKKIPRLHINHFSKFK